MVRLGTYSECLLFVVRDCVGLPRLVILSKATEESQQKRFAALSMTNMID
jgi:hypothetical protein